MLEWVAILTHHDLHVFASLCSKALVNAAHRKHHRSASTLPWTTSDLCQCCIALDLLKWEGALLVALMPSSCLILSGHLGKHYFLVQNHLNFARVPFLPMFQFLFVATTPPPLDVCFELNIKLAKCLLPPAARPTPATLVLLQVFLSPQFSLPSLP